VWHKLLIASRRPAVEENKRKKDLRQAAALLRVLVDERPGDVRLAGEDLAPRGSHWSKGANAGLLGLEDEELVSKVQRLQ